MLIFGSFVLISEAFANVTKNEINPSEKSVNKNVKANDHYVIGVVKSN